MDQLTTTSHLRRNHEPMEVDDVHVDDLTNSELPMDVANSARSNPFLPNGERDLLSLKGDDWIEGKLINAAFFNLKNALELEFRNIRLFQIKWGLQTQDIAAKYVKIFHINGIHWLTASNIDAPVNTVRLYDSAVPATRSYSHNILNDIFLFSNENDSSAYTTFQIMNVEQQPNNFDCGVFALAFATSLTYNQDPTRLSYNNLRSHLYSCLYTAGPNNFPCVDTPRQLTVLREIKKVKSCCVGYFSCSCNTVCEKHLEHGMWIRTCAYCERQLPIPSDFFS